MHTVCVFFFLFRFMFGIFQRRMQCITMSFCQSVPNVWRSSRYHDILIGMWYFMGYDGVDMGYIFFSEISNLYICYWLPRIHRIKKPKQMHMVYTIQALESVQALRLHSICHQYTWVHRHFIGTSFGCIWHRLQPTHRREEKKNANSEGRARAAIDSPSNSDFISSFILRVNLF